jgi:hypothetical protein
MSHHYTSKGGRKFVINDSFADDLLRLIDKGVAHGLGEARPGKMCIEASVDFIENGGAANGGGMQDHPVCVVDWLAELKIELNDRGGWKNNKDRGRGLRRLALVQLGTASLKGFDDSGQFWDAVSEVLKTRVQTLTSDPKVEIGHAAGLWIMLDQSINQLPELVDIVDHLYKDEIRKRVRNESGVNQSLRNHIVGEIMVQALVRLKAPGARFLKKAPPTVKL